jgi:hypothetical protein
MIRFYRNKIILILGAAGKAPAKRNEVFDLLEETR